jgi:hypothetical protein
MNDAFHAHFHYRVRRVYEDYIGIRSVPVAGMKRDIRAAAEAAKVMYHLREHIPPPHGKSWQDVAKQCPDYALLRDVADTEKHGKLSDKTRAICDTRQMEERIIVTEYEDTEGTYRHVEKAVWLNLTDGSSRDLADVLTNVMNYWQDELHALGMLPKSRPYAMAARAQPVPRNEANHGRLDYTIVPGLEFNQTYQLRRYNYSTGKIEPIDLSGASLEFAMYKPAYTLEVKLGNSATGQELCRTASLTEEEYRALLVHGSDEGKGNYLLGLPQVKAAYEELVKEASAAGTASPPAEQR